MSKRPVLEEVDDIDDMDMDIAQFDPNLRTPIGGEIQPAVQQPPKPQVQPPAAASTNIADPRQFSDEEKRTFRTYQVIYPCYFDRNRSHKEGRRVSVDRAVENPLAKTIADACRFYHVPVLLELDKSHPQDFGNPGRVKVLLKKDGEPVDPVIKNKRQILNAIGKFLQQHETTLKSIGPGSGHPIPPEYAQGFEASLLPKVKGFTMNSIVPIHSPLTMKHPMTKSIYEAMPEAPPAPVAPKAPKKKIMKIRG